MQRYEHDESCGSYGQCRIMVNVEVTVDAGIMVYVRVTVRVAVGVII